MRRFWIVLILVLMLGLVRSAPSAAQNLGRIETRLSRLESQVFALRSQLRQLDTTANQPSRPLAIPRRNLPGRTALPAPIAASDSQFDRLATLVIELKERMDRLEQRLNQLDGRDR